MEIFGEIKEDIRKLLEILNIVVLEPANHEEMWSVIERYGLLPNDALIVATCEGHGITKMATFDENFKKVDFLEIFEPPLK